MRSFAFILFLILSIPNFAQENRVALIIGNGNYQNGGALKNPVNDATLMDSTLTALGFEVTMLKDASKNEMDKGILNFWRNLENNDVALFYYAGHGIQVDGTNYLLPVDAVIEDKLALEFEAVDVEKIISQFDSYPENINIVILDACRNNPFRSWVRGASQGFSTMDAPSGTIIAFATAPGATASDGSGNNGLYTEKLTEQMLEAQRIEDVFINTRVEVREASRGYQNPQEWSQLNGKFLFTTVIREANPPEIQVIAPYASDHHTIYLDSDDPIIYIEGKVKDESIITSIYIDGVSASYMPTDLDPVFSARVQIQDKSNFTISATDESGNSTETIFILNREASNFRDNPMGKTWAIFIENSEYERFKSLGDPSKDITLMKTALARYQVHNFIHKKNMTKQEMEIFFAIELRDLISSNRVSSILVWYAGHGKFVNETGYWIPTDAVQDDEFTYFNINALKASMQSYPESLTHNLVVTDACEAGTSFFQELRAPMKIKSCDEWEATRFKSAQLFFSPGYELSEKSQFTRTFANTLAMNPNSCIPIESLVEKVSASVIANKQMNPMFGKIAGLEDENGTFFFILKE